MTEGIRVYDRASRSVIASMPGGAGYAVRGVAMAPDGANLYAVTDGQTVLRRYDAAGLAFMDDLLLDTRQSGVHFVAVSNDGQRVYVSDSSATGTGVYVVDVSGAPKLISTTLGATLAGTPVVLAVQPEVRPSPP